MNLALRLKKIELNRTELNLIRLITSRLQRTAFLTGPELAEECLVSPSAITRLSQKLGYSGYPEMKKALEDMYRKTVTPYEAFESFLSQPEQASIPSVSIAQDLENLQRMRDQLNEQDLKRAVRLIDTAEHIYLVGVAASESLVDLSAAYLETLGKKCTRLKGFGVSKQVELLRPSRSDVWIAFSFQRIVKEVRDSVVLARKKGCKTIAITDSAVNPLAICVDQSFIAPVTCATFGASLAAPVGLINVISNALASHDPKKSLQQLKKAKDVWENYPIFCE